MGEMYKQVQSQTFTKGTNKFNTLSNNITNNKETSNEFDIQHVWLS